VNSSRFLLCANLLASVEKSGLLIVSSVFRNSKFLHISHEFVVFDYMSLSPKYVTASSFPTIDAKNAIRGNIRVKALDISQG